MGYLPPQLRKYMVGPRILKSGLAVLVAEVLFRSIGQGSYAAFAATSAIVAILPSISSSWTQLRKSLIANLLAAGVAILMGLWAENPITLTLSTILVLWLLARIKLGEHAGVVSVTVIWMLSRSPDVVGTYIAGRVIAIAVGTLIGTLVNIYILPPNFLPRIRTGLAEAADQTAQFGERIALALTDPESYTKVEIKATLKKIRGALSLIEQQINWQVEVGTPESIYRPLQKTTAALYVYAVELARTHEAALAVGGLPAGPVSEQVRKTVRAACANLLGVCQPLVRGEAPDAHSRDAYVQAMAELERLVESLIEDRATRELGLACHRVQTSIHHMGRRMRICRETYAQAEAELPAEEGKPVF